MKKAMIIKERELTGLIKEKVKDLGVETVSLLHNEEEDVLVLDLNRNDNVTDISLKLGTVEVLSKNKLSIELFYVGKFLCRDNDVEFVDHELKFNGDEIDIMFYHK